MSSLPADRPLHVDATGHYRRFSSPSAQVFWLVIIIVFLCLPSMGLMLGTLLTRPKGSQHEFDVSSVLFPALFISSLFVAFTLPRRLVYGLRLPSSRPVSGYGISMWRIDRRLAAAARSADWEAGAPILLRRSAIWILVGIGIFLLVGIFHTGQNQPLGAGLFIDDLDVYLTADELSTGFVVAAAAAFFLAYKLAHPRARAASVVTRVWLMRLAGLAVVGLGFLALTAIVVTFNGIWGRDPEHWPLLAKGLALAVLAALFTVVWNGSAWCFARATQLGLATTRDIRRADPRRPIVLLRSFQDDMLLVEWDQYAGDNGVATTIEEAVRPPLARLGPFIAVGEPGQLPAFGAARASFTNDEWQAAVLGWMREARAIVLLAGWTEGLAWEMSQVVQGGHVGKLLVLLPPSKYRMERWSRLCSAFQGTPWHRSMQSLDISQARAVCFNQSGPIVVTSGGERSRDYETATELALYGILCRGG